MDPETAKFVTELSKTLAQSVYGDTFSPALKEVGSFLQDVAKTLRRSLPQLQMTAVDQDRYRRFLEQSIERVPPNQRIAAAEQLLGPVLEGIRYEPEGSMSDNAFSELLSRAFDRERVGQAHPAFPSIIRALADDEMKLLLQLDGPSILWAFSKNIDVSSAADIPRWAADFPFITQAENLPAYAKHLEALGLINHLVAGQQGDASGREEWIIELVLSDFGDLFVKAVHPNQAT